MVVGWLDGWISGWLGGSAPFGNGGHINLPTGRHAAATSVATKECDPIRFDSHRLSGSSTIVNISHGGISHE